MSEHGRIKVQDGELRWESDGDGSPLVLLHGFSFDLRAWTPQVETLMKSHRVIRYDLRGFGASSVPIGPYSHVEDLRRLIEALALKRPVLLGLSLGAVAALSYAVRYPDAISGLILASPGLPGWPWSSPRPPEAAAERARRDGVEAARAFWLDHELFTSARRRGGAYATIAALIGDYSGWHWRTGDQPQWDADLIDTLQRVTAPTLIISGLEDVQGYRDISEALAERLPDARLVKISAGHVANIEAPKAFNAAVLDFLARPQVVQGAEQVVFPEDRPTAP